MTNKRIAVLAAGLLFAAQPAPAQTVDTPVAQHAIILTETLPQIAPEKVETDTPPTVIIKPKPHYSDSEAECVARAMYYEARGEGRLGQKAVAYVVLNRSKNHRFGSTPCNVISQPRQFTWYHASKKIPTNIKTSYTELAKEFIQSYDKSNDPTGGATYFHARYVHPGWRNVRQVATIGNHIFYASR